MQDPMSFLNGGRNSGQAGRASPARGATHAPQRQHPSHRQTDASDRGRARSAFVDYNDLARLVLYDLDERLNNIVVQHAKFRDQIVQLIQWAEAKGKTKNLLLAATREVPGNTRLREAKQSVLGETDLDDLEKIVSSNPALFSDPDAWRRAMIQAEWAVCRVEKPEGQPLGTGFLVAKDLVLTNHHAAFDANLTFRKHAESVRFRFGFREPADGAPEASTTYRLASNWDVHSSPSETLDYAVLRLDRPAGEEPVGDFRNAPGRGWLKLRKADVRQSQGLFILQHPGGKTLKMANGGVRQVSGAWVDYEVNTEPGSSGSPVFNNRWELVALHSRAGTGQFNKGVAISAIVDDLPAPVKALLG
jgi:V8-like Glu-specific endopeptidase